MYKIFALQISDSIDLKSLQNDFASELIFSNHNELFYEVDTEVYISVFKYGAVCFFNCKEERKNDFIKLLSKHCKIFYDSELSKEYNVEPTTGELKFEFNSIKINYIDIDCIKLIMLNIAQSVTLDYYLQFAKIQLGETSKHTELLEKKGNLLLSNKKVKRYIGQTHNLKNQLVENLSIFDIATEIKQNDYLIKIDIGMKEALLMERRSYNIQNELETVREHLDFFSNIINQKKSAIMEWVIVLLLAIFALDVLFRVIFK
jgi:uncharacterized Rmd1/YagE family protein